MINKIGMKGVFNLTVSDKNGNIKHQNESKNLIVDAWLNYYCSLTNQASLVALSTDQFNSANSLFTRFKVGSGSNTPALSNTDLQNTVATINSSASDIIVSNYSYDTPSDSFIFTLSKRMDFPLGGVIANISEVGVFSTGAAGSNIGANALLFSRALVVDGLGNPTTIPVTAEDQLAVTYTLTMIIPRTISGSFLLGATTHNFESKVSFNNFAIPFNLCIGVAFAQTADGVLVRQTDVAYPNATVGLPTSGFDFIGTSVTRPSVVNANTQARRMRMRVPLALGNYAGGIACLAFKAATSGNNGYWLMKFSPFIPKNNQQIFDLEFATEFVRL